MSLNLLAIIEVVSKIKWGERNIKDKYAAKSQEKLNNFF
jgi:hypothetical protein